MTEGVVPHGESIPASHLLRPPSLSRAVTDATPGRLAIDAQAARIHQMGTKCPRSGAATAI